MKLIHQRIDIEKDMDYVLECHCQINYACDTPWAKRIDYPLYREEWFGMKNQLEGFTSYLKETMQTSETIADIIEDANGQRIGYLWVPFHIDEDSHFRFAEIQDIFIEEKFRRQGIAETLFRYIEENARTNGARVIRSGTGCENIQSICLHQKLGFYQYRYEFEKEL